MNVDLQQFKVSGPSEFEVAFLALAKVGVEAVLIQEDAVFVSNMSLVVDLASKHRIPLAGFNELAQAGGLIGYGVDFLAMCHRAAIFVGAILKGDQPANIPVEQATKFSFVINLKTAKALSLDIPQGLVLAADEVVE